MVRGYVRRRTFSRRPVHKRYGKKYNRRRFTKKRFSRNNVNQLTMRAPLASRLLRVKLPWVKTFDQSVAGGGSNSWAFQGNAICPYTASGQTGANTPAAGDSLPAGAVEYSQLYDKYFINGSSIKIEAINSATVNTATSTQVLRCVLLAIPFDNNDSTDNWTANKAQLDAYTYEQLLAWPYAKWRMIGISSGGAPRLTMKMFRKTKNMCGLKDLRDNEGYGTRMTDGLALSTHLPGLPDKGFMYYFRVFNNLGSTATTVAITVRTSLYCTLTNREFNPIQTITTP